MVQLKVVRINLSEQTDMMDLLGSDLPQSGMHNSFLFVIVMINLLKSFFYLGSVVGADKAHNISKNP